MDKKLCTHDASGRSSVNSHGSNVVGKLARSRPTRRRSTQNANSENAHPNSAPCFGSLGRSSGFARVPSSTHPSSLKDVTNVPIAPGRQGTKVERSWKGRPLSQVAPTFKPIVDEARAVRLVFVDEQQINVQDAEEYTMEVEKQLFIDEVTFRPKSSYIASQQDLTSVMRMILVDWLIEMHMTYCMRNEVLHLTINLTDRFLSLKAVSRNKLQLIGVAAVLIASKYEEIHPPEVRELVRITDNAYTKDELLKMEVAMLSVLDFEIMVPTAVHFFDILQSANGCDEVHRMVAQYILELGLLDIRMLQYAPSHVASAALLLSNYVLKRRIVWPSLMSQRSRRSASELEGCVSELRQLFDADQSGAGCRFRAVYNKFAAPERHSVSKRTF